MNAQANNRPGPIIGHLNIDDNTFFASDQHLSHFRINRFCNRGFDTLRIDEDGHPIPDIDAMNADIVAKHNSVVSSSDTVIFVGDVCMGRTGNAGDPQDPKEGSLDFISQMNGRKIMILGNHDKAAFFVNKSVNRRDRMIAMFKRAGFDEVFDHVTANFNGKRFVINHFPYEGDHMEEDRYSSIRPEFNGTPIVHGHVHDLWKVKRFKGVAQVNVGIDSHGGFPQRIQEVVGRFDSEDDLTKTDWVH